VIRIRIRIFRVVIIITKHVNRNNWLKSFYIVNPKATCHITRQASINARASVRYLFLFYFFYWNKASKQLLFSNWRKLPTFKTKKKTKAFKTKRTYVCHANFALMLTIFSNRRPTWMIWDQWEMLWSVLVLIQLCKIKQNYNNKSLF